LGILLRVQQGMTIHFKTITFIVSLKILIFYGRKMRILNFGKKKNSYL